MLMYEAMIGARPRRRLRLTGALVGLLALGSLGAALPRLAGQKQEGGSALIEVLSSGRKSKELRTIVEHTQARLLFSKDISERIAIGSEEIAKIEKVVSKREILVSAAKIGTTSLMVWFADGSVEQYMFAVARDLSVLESALHEISPAIQVEMAPDRDAIVLTGTVSTRELYDAAQKAAADYLSAGSSERKTKDEAEKPGAPVPTLAAQGHVINRLKITTSGTPLEEIMRRAAETLGAKGAQVTRIVHGDHPDDQYDQFVISGSVSDRGVRDEILAKADTIVRRFDPDPKRARTVESTSPLENRRITEYERAPDRIHDRLTIQAPPAPSEPRKPSDPEPVAGRKPAIVERMEDALRVVGCDTSRVHADVVEGLGDGGVLVLSGSVPDQTCLLRILTIAASLVGADAAKDLDIQVVGDESGALRRGEGQAGSMFGSGIGELFSGAASGSGGRSQGFARLLNNNLGSNIARAKAVQLAGGKIISFLQVQDLPQVRIDIRLYEVNRSALLSWQPSSKFSVADFKQNGINPNNVAHDADGNVITNSDGEPLLTADGTDARDVLSFLGGGFSNLAQVGGERIRVDSLLSLLESEGIARTLSNPSLTVLSGEQAFFGVGGSIPIQQQTLTAFGNGSTSTLTNSGILNGVEFRDFGIRLAVRPLIDEQGFVTLDVVPTVSNPDADLTTLVRSSTGTNPQTVAFQERSLRTSARLRDGQVLLIGGLVEHSRIDDANQTPFLHKIPLVGWLFKGFNYADSDRELVIVVSPVIVRDAAPRRSLWAFPDGSELMPKPPPKPAPRPKSAEVK